MKKKGGEDEEELEEDLEGDFLDGRTQHVKLARYESDSDQCISLLDNIAKGCF